MTISEISLSLFCSGGAAPSLFDVLSKRVSLSFVEALDYCCFLCGKTVMRHFELSGALMSCTAPRGVLCSFEGSYLVALRQSVSRLGSHSGDALLELMVELSGNSLLGWALLKITWALGCF